MNIFAGLFGSKKQLVERVPDLTLDATPLKSTTEQIEQTVSSSSQVSQNPSVQKTLSQTQTAQTQTAQTQTAQTQTAQIERKLERDSFVQQSDYFSNLRRRLDSEMRERAQLLKVAERKLYQKIDTYDKLNEELIQKQKILEQKEIELDAYKKKFHELQDKELTLTLKEKQLKSQIDKQEELHAKNDEKQKDDRVTHSSQAINQKNAGIEQIEREKNILLKKAPVFLEFVEEKKLTTTQKSPLFLEQNSMLEIPDEHENERKIAQEQLLQQQLQDKQELERIRLDSTKHMLKSELETYLTENIRFAYMLLQASNYGEVKRTFNQIKRAYTEYKEFDKDQVMYSTILLLHEDIMTFYRLHA